MRTSVPVGLGIAAMFLLAACSSDAPGPSTGDDEVSRPAPSATALPELVVPDEVAFDEPVRVEVAHGVIESVEVVPDDDGEPLAGDLDPTGWVSAAPPLPGLTYQVAAEVVDEVGSMHALTGSFSVAPVPDERRLTLALQPGDGHVVGVGAPIIVRFDQEVTEQAAVEQAMLISSNPQVTGGWHWVSSTEAHFRPQEFWAPGTQVGVDLDLNGVQAADDVWGGRAYTYRFEIGPAHVATVDAATHSMTVAVAGSTVHRWDTSLGKPEFATRNGTYVVQSKEENRNMTSCGAGITCDSGNSEYYDIDVDWAVRLSWSGTFVHAAPWSEGSQGSANVSHGCVNLSEANAETYYDLVRYGDVVVVENSTREADELVRKGDPGMIDWNMSWSQYVAGSALGSDFTTSILD